MTTRRWWVIGCALVVVVSIGLGWLIGASPLLDAARVADETRAGVEAQNLALDQELIILKEQFAGIDALETRLVGLQAEVPAGSALPEYVAQLVSDAQQHTMTLTSITVSDAVAYTPLVAEAPVSTTTDDASDDAGTPAPSDVAVPTPTVGAGTAVTSPLVTGQNFVAIPITVALDGGYGNVLDFVESLQKGSRLTTVTAFSTTRQDAPAAAADGDNAPAAEPAASDAVKGTLSLYIYVLLGPATGQ